MISRPFFFGRQKGRIHHPKQKRCFEHFTPDFLCSVKICPKKEKEKRKNNIERYIISREFIFLKIFIAKLFAFLFLLWSGLVRSGLV
jgi:hypothetical protein